jgi:hypothetical protein
MGAAWWGLIAQGHMLRLHEVSFIVMLAAMVSEWYLGRAASALVPNR